MIQSLCEKCTWMREIVTPKRSRFLLCRLSQRDPIYPKYPRQPVVQCDGYGERESHHETVIPLYQDPFFTFRFADDRIIPRFHLEGVPAGVEVRIFSANSETLQPGNLLGTAVVGEGGWVDLPKAIVVRAGEVFVVFPEPHEEGRTPQD
jgi:hypothetical protein